MIQLLPKYKLTIYRRKINEFWDEFRRNRIGILGLALLVFFVFLAIFAPYVAQYPQDRPPIVASKFAMPEWVSMFPQFAGLPRTAELGMLEINPVPNSFVEVYRQENVTLNYLGNSSADVGTARFSLCFPYLYKSPKEFAFKLDYSADGIIRTRYNFDVTLIDTNGTEWKLIDRSNTFNITTGRLTLSSTSTDFWRRIDPSMLVNPASLIFANKGNYTINLTVSFQPTSNTAQGRIVIRSGILKIFGSLHGILGTDFYGHDFFSIVIYGTRMSMIIGVATAAVTTVLGLAIGTTAGYLGGKVDAIIMRVVDIVLCMPLFVIILQLVSFYKIDIYVLIVIFSLFWWAGAARIIRSKVLSLKESMFIESAKIAGGTKFYIIRTQLIPNVLPIAMASLTLFVPAAILVEASMSFLGFGDPRMLTWGRTLSEAKVTGAFTSLAWWVVIPPGLAIALLCVSFVFIAHALDTIVNPRLRKRK